MGVENAKPDVSLSSAVSVSRSFEFQVSNLEKMQEFANIFALIIKSLSITVLLNGSLGAGKTTFVRFVLQCLGCTDRVKSPTYNMVHEYDLPNTKIYHLDLYRVENIEELVHIDLHDYISQPGNISFIEWGLNKNIVADLDITITSLSATDLVDIDFTALENAPRSIKILSLSLVGEIALELFKSLYSLEEVK